MFSEAKKYIDNKKPSIKHAIAIGKALAREVVALPESTHLSDREQVELAFRQKEIEKSEKFAQHDKIELVNTYFYKPYVEERARLVRKLHDEGINVNSSPLEAALVSLRAASRAGNIASGIPSARGFMYEFRLPEQYLLSNGSEKIDQSTNRVKLIPETRLLAAEIVQAWIMADYHAEPNLISDKTAIIHNSLRHANCSFMSTCMGTDLTFEDIGVTSHIPATAFIGDRESTFLQYSLGFKVREASYDVMVGEMNQSFMQRVQTWDTSEDII